MKPQLCFSFMLCLASTSALSTEKTTSTQLAKQTMTAESAHLTTRIQWIKFPQIRYEDADLKSQDRYAIVRIKANESGEIVDASVKESTGLQKLDQMLLKAIYSAQTKPFQKDGNELSVIGYQSFSLKLSDEMDNCQFNFDSKIWQAQQDHNKTPFTYQQQPQIQINSSNLQGHHRHVKFSFNVDKKGNVKSSKITKGSGIYSLDQQILNAVNHAKVDVPRKYWIYKKSKLKDEIQFNLNHCQ